MSDYDEEDDDSGSTYESSSEESETIRPNRWQGAPSTWLSITEQERGLAESLDALRHRDLGVHLWSTWGLRVRAREVSQNKLNAGGPESKGEAEENEEPEAFVPPKTWAAWPLPAEDVPREVRDMRDADGFEEFTFRRRGRERPSRELEEVLLGTTLRCAKERFEKRDWAKKHKIRKEEEEVDDKDWDEGQRVKASTENIDDATPPPGQAAEAEIIGSEDTRSTHEENEHEDPAIKVKEDSVPPPKTWLQPVTSADDERSRELLRPSIRHTLSKLDEVLVALHHARQTCRRYSRTEVITDDEGRASSVVCNRTTSLNASRSPAERPRGRPRKFASLPDRSIAEETVDDAALFRTKKTHLGRPQKNYERLEGETQQEYLIRIARIQKKPLPIFAATLEPSPSLSPTRSERSTKSPIRKSNPEEAAARRNRQLGLRDWSEVLGSAALVGFSPDVIARAAQRCADLFGESMSMRSIVEAPFAQPVDLLKTYHPSLIPALASPPASVIPDDSNASSSEAESDAAPAKKGAIKGKRKLKAARIEPSRQNAFCPFTYCPRKIQGFRNTSDLKRHLRKGHGIKAGQEDEWLVQSEDEMDGAVHVDGFLRPLKPRWRGENVAGKGRRRDRGKKGQKRGREVVDENGSGGSDNGVEVRASSSEDEKSENGESGEGGSKSFSPASWSE